jgi:hypothetical protein
VPGAAAMMSEPVPVLEPVYFPAGVADPPGDVGYVADPPGIAAVALADGRPLWHSDDAATPVLADGERLIAVRAPPLEVVVLRDGEVVLVSDPVPLPSWAAEPSAIRAHASGARLHLEWEAHTRYAGGAPPPPHVLREATRDATGAAEVDLESGACKPAEPVEAAARRPPLDASDLEKPWLAGDTVVRLVWDVRDGEQTLVLEPGSKTLARGHGLVAQPTVDGTHLLVGSEPAPGAWSIFALPSGQRVATVTHDPGAKAPAIMGDRVYYLVESPGARALRARELGTDTLVWELPLTAPPTSGAPRLRP